MTSNTTRFPKRTSSLSADDFPHGPPNSPSSKVNSRDINAIDAILALIPEEDVPLQDKEQITMDEKIKQEQEAVLKMVDQIQVSLSNVNIEELLDRQFGCEYNIGADDQYNNDDYTDSDSDDADAEEETVNSAWLSDESPAGIVRPPTPMVPLWFGSKSESKTVDQSGDIDKDEIDSGYMADRSEDGDGHGFDTDSEAEPAASLGSDASLYLSFADRAFMGGDAPTPPPAVEEAELEHQCGAEAQQMVTVPGYSVTGTVTDKTKGCADEPAQLGALDDAADRPEAEVVYHHLPEFPTFKSRNENKLTAGQFVPKKKIFVIAISGCSSAGKSLLTKILSSVLDSLSTSPANKGTIQSKPTLIIAQDDFFHPRSLQPLVTFKSGPADSHFIEKSIHSDHLGMYYITESGTRPSCSGEKLLACFTGSHHGQRTNSFDSADSDDSRTIEGGHKPRYNITGPMADCDQALDFVGLFEAVDRVKATGHPTEYAKRFPCNEEMENFATLIEEMKEKASAWAKQQSVLNAEARFGGCLVRGPIENDGKKAGAERNGKESLRPQFVFVEGFLLLAPSSPSPSTATKPYTISIEKAKVSKYITQLLSLSAELAAKNNAESAIEGERDVIEAQLWATNLVAKKHLQGMFDIKLFLNTSKGESKRRRFAREIYSDEPEGTRLPGQMWKSEGYFKGVVWKGFEENHRWLLKSEGDKGGEKGREGKELLVVEKKVLVAEKKGEAKKQLVDSAEHGVFVEPDQDAAVEVRVRWAMGVILAEMARLEGEARIVGGGCCNDD